MAANAKSRAPDEEPRVIRIFVASPSDVSEERAALAGLVREINDALTFLMPEKRLSLELIRYETHAFPDVGQAQEVINRQIPIDYDILIGLMWRRCGTPTTKYASGTIEEFWRAYEHRKTHGRPTIMFYFCDQPIPMPSSEELQQLSGVIGFREELAGLGYTVTYPTHADFREYVRGGLLRALKSMIDARKESKARSDQVDAVSEPVAVEEEARQAYVKLAEEYERVRRDMSPGGPRTRRMTSIFNLMLAQAPAVRALLLEFERSASAGERLGAIAILHMFPSGDHLDWLAERLNHEEERPFVGYQAAVGLLHAVRSLPRSQCARLKSALANARKLAERLTTDPPRIEVLRAAEAELAAKCGRTEGRTAPRQTARPAGRA